MTYCYGMRLRGYSIGSQPKEGFIKCLSGDRTYHNYLFYNRKLTDKECSDYELDYRFVAADGVAIHKVRELVEIKCLHCEEQIEEGWHYCPYCGRPIHWNTIERNLREAEEKYDT